MGGFGMPINALLDGLSKGRSGSGSGMLNLFPSSLERSSMDTSRTAACRRPVPILHDEFETVGVLEPTQARMPVTSGWEGGA